ncbi:PD-(D/E)XK nuclease family protein [Agilicoccus flavus]|uniref:PD-(D/E)XK nuclease family protein n=1 Tax=Agilicoccus flavus TaxID=2775968 RepID=UPI001CF6DFE4|nr:PD-(D/E)XK nuclease family protein [Agilicoccus flavus]
MPETSTTVLARPAPAVPDGWPAGRAADESQWAAVTAWTPRGQNVSGGGGRVRRVLGAPGTGKTSVAVGVVVHRVRRHRADPDRCLLVAPTRVGAAALREHLTARLGATTTRPLARTLQSFAFGLLSTDAARRGDPTPRLLTGAEQDVVLRDLLRGHGEGGVPRPAWPGELEHALATRGFRAELRDLLMRAVELGVEAHELADLGRYHGRPEWVGAADVLREYDQVTALAFPGAYDPAWVLGCAADLVEDDDETAADLAADLDLVVVDDAQELTRAGLRLLTRLAALGVEIVLVGDPDVTTGTFRGADPHVVGRDWVVMGAGPTHVLEHAHRGGPGVRAALDRVTARIGSAGAVGHRGPAPWPGGTGGSHPSGRDGLRDEVEVTVVGGAAAEAALVAERLRAAHLLERVPWSAMAVVVRAGDRVAHLRRVLTARGVPVRAGGAQVALRDEPAVRPLLTLVDVVTAGTALDADVVLDLLMSPLVGADSLAMRRLRRALHRAELAAGGRRGGDGLLLAALDEPELLDDPEVGPAGEPARRLRRILAAGRAAARRVTDPAEATSGPDRPDVPADLGAGDRPGGADLGGHDDAGGPAGVPDTEEVLWALWEACGVAEPWRAAALSGGGRGAQADRDLDAVLALFDAAQAYARHSGGRGPEGFLEHVNAMSVAGDSLARAAVERDSVTLSTVSGVAGAEFDLVCVAGVQEGAWPDLRVRGSLLGSSALLDVATGRAGDERAARRAVRADETRLFLSAIGRARRRLLVTAVSDDDQAPSTLLDLVDPPTGDDRPVVEVGDPLSLAGVVGALRRRAVLDADPGARAHAADRLAVLAASGVRGADPGSWWHLRDVSDRRPVRADDAAVAVSPSRVETFSRCGLRWLLTGSGGDDPRRGGAADVGTLVHDIAATVDNGDEAALLAALDDRSDELGPGQGWIARRRLEAARGMLRRLAAYDLAARADGWEVVGTELDARARIGRAAVTGRVDRLERRADGALRVVDLKTGSSKPTAAQLPRHPQLGTYQAAVEHGAFGEAGDVSAGAALVQLGRAAGVAPTVQEQASPASDDDPRWAEQLVTQAAEGMAGGTFDAQVGPWCRVCPLRTACPLQPEGGRL